MKRLAMAILMVGVLLFAGCGLSEAELEEKTTAAYDQGYDVGYSEGETAAYNTGYDEGYNDGYSYGYDDGYATCQRERSGEEIPAALDQYQDSELLYRPVELSYSIAGCDHYLIHMKGNIISILERTITIAAKDNPDDTFSIEIGADVPVTIYAPGETVIWGITTYHDSREIEFESLQVGDTVNLVLNLSMCEPESPEVTLLSLKND